MTRAYAFLAGAEAATHIDRNANHYRARPVTEAAATQAATAAQLLYQAATARLTTT